MVYIIFATLQYQRANLHKTAEIINDYHKNNVKGMLTQLRKKYTSRTCSMRGY